MNGFTADAENMNRENTLAERAAEFAKAAHAGQVRKGTETPYIVHPMAVMEIVSGITEDEEVRAAAVLHDTVEDTETTQEDIENLFGRRVAELVGAESENKREGLPEKETWVIRKLETLDHLAKADYNTQVICLGDKLANMRDIARDRAELGDGLWERFNAPEDGKGTEGKKANIGWYYRGIADRLKNMLGDTEAWQELDRLVKEVFGLKVNRAKLIRGERMPGEEDEENAACYILDPVAVIDTDRVIESWADSWLETFVYEQWKLSSYSVMADGTVLVVFSMEDEVYEMIKGEAKAVHTNTIYRVLQYRLGEDGPEVTGKYRFKLQDGSAKKVFVRDGMLFAAVSRDGSAKATVLQLFPNDDDEQFGIGKYVRDAVQRSNGELFVSRFDAQNENRKRLVTKYDAEKETAESYYTRNAVSCKALTMDADENIWYHSYPSNEITEIGRDNEFGENHLVALQGFRKFALSDDRSRLVAEFSEYNDESLIFIMHRDSDGDYGMPVRFAFEPTDDHGHVLTSEECNFFGCPEVCKATMILRADGKLYWYDVNSFCDCSAKEK